MSERKPINARQGATSIGIAIIAETSHADTPSSTIITRFNVPTSSAPAMPTDTWNSDSRSSRDSGSETLAASANGSSSGVSRRQWREIGFMWAPAPSRETCRSHR